MRQLGVYLSSYVNFKRRFHFIYLLNCFCTRMAFRKGVVFLVVAGLHFVIC